MDFLLADAVAAPETWWHWVALILVGTVARPVVEWLSGWIDGKGAKFVKDELTKVQAKLNENTLLGQIHADDAVIGVLQSVIPEVLHDLTEATKTAIQNGQLHTVDWKAMGVQIWDKAKPQIVAGEHDYLEHSSFEDGATIAAVIAERFFKTQKAQKDGLLVPGSV